MQNIFLALLLYSQNFLISFISKNYFEPSIIEFALIYSIVLLINSFKYKTYLLILWQLLYTVQFLFISFFGSPIQPQDVTLFFTHIGETFETFIPLISTFVPIFIFSIIILIISIKLSTKTKLPKLLPLLMIAALFSFQTKISDLSIKFIYSIINTPLTYTQNIQRSSNTVHPISTPNDLNIVLVLGESLRYKNLSLFNYTKPTTPNLLSIKDKLFYNTIYSAATNTDVSVPLFINGATNPENINLSNNLFTLAQNNRFITTFTTTQSKKSLKYIKPYLGENIDIYNILDSKDDIDLFTDFKQIAAKSGNHFTIFQMTGQHSPYKYYPKGFNHFGTKTTVQNYDNTILYTDFVLYSMIAHIIKNNQPTIFIFTSDHGELIGINGQYGHNRFHKDIYTVPLIVFTHKVKFDLHILNNIKTHHHLYQWIYTLLGYNTKATFSPAPYRINGTMITGEDGHIMVD